MSELVFTFGVMFVFIFFLIGLKIFAKIIYFVFFLPIIAGINKLFVIFLKKEERQNKLQQKGKQGALSYILKYFLVLQYSIGGILIILYSCGIGYLFYGVSESFVTIGVVSFFYLSYCFYIGKHKYALSENDPQKEYLIEGLDAIDFGDILGEINFDI